MPLGWSIPFGDMPTVGAFLARVPRIDKDHWYTSERGLVRHALPQLEESPIGVPWSLRAVGLNPLSDTRQIFQGDPSSGALRSIHEPFGDGMVDILLKPGLLALEQLESSPRRSCSMALQAFASGLVSLAFPIHCRARVHCAIRVQGEVDYAKVHAKHPLNSHPFQFLLHAGHKRRTQRIRLVFGCRAAQELAPLAALLLAVGRQSDTDPAVLRQAVQTHAVAGRNGALREQRVAEVAVKILLINALATPASWPEKMRERSAIHGHILLIVWRWACHWGRHFGHSSRHGDRGIVGQDRGGGVSFLGRLRLAAVGTQSAERSALCMEIPAARAARALGWIKEFSILTVTFWHEQFLLSAVSLHTRPVWSTQLSHSDG